MNQAAAEETQFNPLSSDTDIQDRIEQLIGRAISRQVWLVFLDEHDVQLPLLIPIDGLPELPTDDHLTQVIDRLREVMGEIGASAIIVVIERYGAAALTDQDMAWARAIRRGCADRGIALRAQLLSHRGGVRWITADDLGDAESN